MLMLDEGRCTLIEKSLGRDGEAIISQKEDIHVILKLFPQ